MTAEPVGNLQTALAHTARLLARQPHLAVEQAQAILQAVPGQPQAQLYLGIGERRSGNIDAALTILHHLHGAQPRSADGAYEYGVTLAEAGRMREALKAFDAATTLRPNHIEAWRRIGDAHAITGDAAAADAAYAMQIRASVTDPRLIEAAVALGEGQLAVAEGLLRAHLKAGPTDVAAIRMLAEVAMRLGRTGDAEKLLTRCLDLMPSFDAARRNYATVLHRVNKQQAALEQIDLLLARDPRDPGTRNLRAAILARIGDFTGSIAHYADVLADYPAQPKAWMSYGHALKTVGRIDDAIAAYRTATQQLPQLGEAWWSLANLKTWRFSDDDVALMQTQLARGDIDIEDRFHLDFALGKAFEDRHAYRVSFTHYAAANALRRTQIDYDPEALTSLVARSKAVFTTDFFAERRSMGCSAIDPIFVVGLPRSGSTLIEQILSSHSRIEGTTELPDIIALAKRLGQRMRGDEISRYPEIIANLSPDEIATLGTDYLATTRIQRRSDKPLFIDKMPNNFQHIGLIATIFPNAKIIDARRHPMGCCFSGFKQHFARGQNFTTSLTDIGRYYRDYVALMTHIDTVFPGRVHRVFYEQMVADSEGEIRALLEYCGVEFEQSCLDFHQTERAIRTPSSEQVRQPIYTDGVEQWQNYASWLGELRAALGPVLDAYPGKSHQ